MCFNTTKETKIKIYVWINSKAVFSYKVSFKFSSYVGFQQKSQTQQIINHYTHVYLKKLVGVFDLT